MDAQRLLFFYLIGLLLTGLLSGCVQQEPEAPTKPRPIRALQVGDATAFAQRSFPGRARAYQEVNLSFRVAGPLITRPINVGDTVEAGQTLARIDPTDFEIRVLNLQSELERAKAERELAEAEYNRGVEVQQRGQGLISESDVDQRRSVRDQARANERALEASLRAAQNDLSYTELKAPFEGTVVAIFVENFETVQAKQAITRLLDTSRIEMVVNIPENLISLVPYVQNLRVRFDAFADRDIPAKIQEIGFEASTTTRTFPVTLIMDQPEGIKILPGMAGRAFGEARLPNVEAHGIVIPVAATFATGESDETYVWVFDKQRGKVSRRAVSVGALTDSGIRVTDGLEPGEWIAVAGVHTLREDQPVRLLDDAGATQ